MTTFLICVTGCLHVQHSRQMCSGPTVPLHRWDHVTPSLWFSCLPQHSDKLFSQGARWHLSGRTTSIPHWTFPTSTGTHKPRPLEKGPEEKFLITFLHVPECWSETRTSWLKMFLFLLGKNWKRTIWLLLFIVFLFKGTDWLNYHLL